MATYMWDERRAGHRHRNLPPNLTPGTIAEAYEAQERYQQLAARVYGPVQGVKVATTTKVMQSLMGISHPCAGAIFSRTILGSPARVGKADYINLRVESEIALEIGSNMPIESAPWTAEEVLPFVAGAMAAYELIEDRYADYGETNAVSMIVENCWNGGVVIGRPSPVAPKNIVGAVGRQMRNGTVVGEGAAEDPFATLAWLANQQAERGHSITAGMVVITGSLIPTFSVEVGYRLVFAVDGLGEAVLDVT